MKAEKLPSGAWRVRKMVNGRRYAHVFDHKPTQAEIIAAFASQYEPPKKRARLRMRDACVGYVESKSNILSPSTIRGYQSIIRNMPQILLDADITDIDAHVIQMEVNAYARVHAPKSVKNYHGFISSVLGYYRPDLTLNTTLPVRHSKDEYMPSTDDIKRIIDAARGTRYELPFLLASHGLRKSEICALDCADLKKTKDGRYIVRVNKAMVQDADNKWVIKSTKTTASDRDVPVTAYTAGLFGTAGRACDLYPHAIYKALSRYQARLGIPHFRLHLMRHYFASVLHGKIPDIEIQKIGGWKNGDVLRGIYQHAMKEREKKTQEKVIDALNELTPQ